MADSKITALTALTTLLSTDILPVVSDPGGTPVTKKVTIAVLLASIQSLLNSPEGFLMNGKIVVTQTSNNLTVALKGLDGNNPSSTNPVYVRIGGVMRSITAALSVTKNAGTNWCNSGSTELATQEIDYFVYLGYNVTDGVTIGFSRIPHINIYSGFGTTSTDERYCAISTITNAAASDAYVNIGRFAATLSAGAGYTWTVPTFNADNLIQRPIFETQRLQFNGLLTASAGVLSNLVYQANHYKLIGNQMTITIYTAFDLGTATAATLSEKVPFATSLMTGFGGQLYNGSVLKGLNGNTGVSNTASFTTTDGANHIVAANQQIRCTFVEFI